MQFMIQTCARPSSVVCLSSSVTLCIVAKRCVLEQKLLLSLYVVVYEKLIGTKMNDLDLLFRGRIKVTLTTALHFTLNISETIRDRGLVTMERQ